MAKVGMTIIHSFLFNAFLFFGASAENSSPYNDCSDATCCFYENCPERDSYNDLLLKMEKPFLGVVMLIPDWTMLGIRFSNGNLTTGEFGGDDDCVCPLHTTPGADFVTLRFSHYLDIWYQWELELESQKMEGGLQIPCMEFTINIHMLNETGHIPRVAEVIVTNLRVEPFNVYGDFGEWISDLSYKYHKLISKVIDGHVKTLLEISYFNFLNERLKEIYSKPEAKPNPEIQKKLKAIYSRKSTTKAQGNLLQRIYYKAP